MKIAIGRKSQSKEIASLIMTAMNHDCCQFYAGRHHTLQDFHDMMTKLVEREDSQYSYNNTIVAMENDEIAGILVCYDGATLYTLRKAFIQEAKDAFGIDYSHIDDETQEGELYLDSLAVNEKFRHQGVATSLLKTAIEKAQKMNIGKTGLLVDVGNPKAEELYRSIGFRYIDDKYWGGHKMKHLQY